MEEDWDNEDGEGATLSSNSFVKNNSFSDEFENGAERKRDRENRNNRGGGGRTYDFVEEMNIRSDCVGRIIGRAGSNIQRIQNDYNVRVDLDKGRNVVKVSSSSEGNLKDALQHIKEQMEQSNDRGGERRNDRGGDRGYRGGEGGSNRYGEGGGGNRYGEGGSGNRYGDGGGGNRYGEASGGNRGYEGGGSNKGHREGERGGYERRSEGYKSYEDNSKRFDDKSSKHNKNDFYNQIPDDIPTTDGVINWDLLNKKAEDEREKRWAKCPSLTKNFYNESPEVVNMCPEEVNRIRTENNNTTVSRVFEQKDAKHNDIPNPVWKFEQCFSDYPDLLDEIYKQNFSKPSPIQSQAWPVLLKGEDLIGIAQTGTGKTLAFLLPAMIHTELQTTPRHQRGGPNVLIMAPTRELALQIEKEVNKYSFRGMRAVCVYGGGSRKDQITSVESGAEIIICTPGRLNDLIQANVIDVASITYLILDEADRMLDMGFEPQIRKILLDIRPDRQTVMTSATWPPGVRRLAQSYMNNPIQVCVGSLDLAATHTVRQIVEIIEDTDKFYTIKNFIKNMTPDDKIIIFCGRKTRADDLSSDLTLEGTMCQCIHGSREQSDREQAIADITSGDVRILIATDVASRGLDIEDITHVINFDFPRNIEEYVHRVGRTGRAGRLGTSISYVTRTDWAVAKELIEILEEADQEVPQELRQMSERFAAMKERRAKEMSSCFGSGGGRGHRGGGNRNRY